MKITVKLEGLTEEDVDSIKYYLGPTADEEYISDPRHQKPIERRDGSYAMEVHLNLRRFLMSAEDVATRIETFAVSMRKP